MATIRYGGPDGPTITFNQWSMDNRMSYFLNPKIVDDYGETCYQYKTKDLIEGMRELMQALDFNFDVGDIKRKTEEFSEQELIFYRPFAYLLSALDGNCFYNCDPEWHDRTRGFVDCYVPSVFNLLYSKAHRDDVIKFMREALAVVEEVTVQQEKLEK